ncbi:hypothetical protein LX16_0969 [Stackebrandtia albiflava]|uniref:ARB-07466-like C-terminal domain-containing protein n=1 Tax=Stackebrandtia albiflava TaxID=406432 RepID=A0A562VBL6_9ACTN|nr:hypothetical protein LX16_0969 [Stackebrandtia albiflava]
MTPDRHHGAGRIDRRRRVGTRCPAVSPVPSAAVPSRLPVRFLIAAVASIVLLLSSPAVADPAEGESDLGGDLSAAIEEYLAAEEALAASETRQEEIKETITESEAEIETLTAEVNDFAEVLYTTRSLSSATAILSTGSPDVAIDGLTTVSYLGDQSGIKLRELRESKEDLEAEKQSLEDEIAAAEKALDDLRDARDAAASAIAANGGNATTGPSPGDFRAADPAPRNTDGSLPYESCSVDDPTPASGCLTPRTLHALQQAQISGFQRFVSCYRGGTFGEHPLGRACDFSVQPSQGFGGVAVGADKEYGDNLAAWFVENASALGVMYVIWYNQYWDPAQGWIAYNGGGGDPSSDHTNHVHLSMRLPSRRFGRGPLHRTGRPARRDGGYTGVNAVTSDMSPACTGTAGRFGVSVVCTVATHGKPEVSSCLDGVRRGSARRRWAGRVRRRRQARGR